MANPPRTRKRVHAIRRAPDGSAYEKCDRCGFLVAFALVDMHECGIKVGPKRFKGVCQKPNVVEQNSADGQLRSPFRFFMESFVKTCKSGKMIDIDRIGFDAWKNMSEEEKQPYFVQADKVDAAHRRALFKGVNNIAVVYDEAHSAVVGKVDKFYEDSEDDEESKIFWHSGFESLNTSDCEIAQAWVFKSLSRTKHYAR